MPKHYATLPILFVFAAGCHRWPQHEPEPGPPTTLDPACDAEYDGLAREVLASLGACESDADCTFAARSPGCLSPFLCSVPIAQGNDAAYEDAATQLVDEYVAECGNFCRVADCVGPERLRAACDTSIGQCVVQDRPSDGSPIAP